MVNEVLFEQKVKESGKTKNYLAEKLGCTPATLRNKATNRFSFNSDEIVVLCRELNIRSLTEREKIFFARDVGK